MDRGAYENLVVRVARAYERSAPSSRPPSAMVPIRSDTSTQTEDVNPAPCDETQGPRNTDAFRLERIEQWLGRVQEHLLRETSRKKRVFKARKRREKQRRKKAALAPARGSPPSCGTQGTQPPCHE
jgi:hypothetical protein